MTRPTESGHVGNLTGVRRIRIRDFHIQMSRPYSLSQSRSNGRVYRNLLWKQVQSDPLQSAPRKLMFTGRRQNDNSDLSSIFQTVRLQLLAGVKRFNREDLVNKLPTDSASNVLYPRSPAVMVTGGHDTTVSFITKAPFDKNQNTIDSISLSGTSFAQEKIQTTGTDKICDNSTKRFSFVQPRTTGTGWKWNYFGLNWILTYYPLFVKQFSIRNSNQPDVLRMQTYLMSVIDKIKSKC